MMQRTPKYLLAMIVALLLLSGSLRLGDVALAAAGSADSPVLKETPEPETGAAARSDVDIGGLVTALRDRQTALDAREAALDEREKSLELARTALEKNLTDLKEMEAKLARTVASVDGASAADIDRLVAVYETMKPKTAIPLFSQMTADFAAGFLSRMSPDAAAAIMSGLPADHSYAISVVLAGRNANAPQK